MKRLIVSITLAATLAFTDHASAQVLVGADFVPNGQSAYGGTGVLGESFVAFHPANSGSNSGTLVQGPVEIGSSGVYLTIAYPSVSDSYPGNDYYQSSGNAGTLGLYNNYLVQQYGTGADDGLEFTLSGLTPGLKYEIAAYSSANGNYLNQTPIEWTVGLDTTANQTAGTATPFSPDSTTASSANAGNGNSFQLGLNYITTTTTANVSGDIILHAFAPNAAAYDVIEGISIEAIPEPSSLWLLASGLALLAVGWRILPVKRHGPTIVG